LLVVVPLAWLVPGDWSRVLGRAAVPLDVEPPLERAPEPEEPDPRRSLPPEVVRLPPLLGALRPVEPPPSAVRRWAKRLPAVARERTARMARVFR
jgi:hypothetical protein